MADLLVKLYNIPSAQPDIDALAKKNIVIRRPIGPENWGVISWIQKHFSDGWASEAENAFFRSPKGIYIAIRETVEEDGRIKPEMLGFACYDATVKGFFGPTGVDEKERGQGIGKALLLACLNAMYGLRMAIGSEQSELISGNISDSASLTFDDEGVTVIIFQYSKDGSDNDGSDCATVRNFRLI